MHDDILDGHNF